MTTTIKKRMTNSECEYLVSDDVMVWNISLLLNARPVQTIAHEPRSLKKRMTRQAKMKNKNTWKSSPDIAAMALISQPALTEPNTADVPAGRHASCVRC